MSRYVPPSKRDKKAEVVIKPSDFPALSSVSPKNMFSYKKSFASLATDWNEQSEEDKIAEEYRKAMNTRETERLERDRRMIVTHHHMEERIQHKESEHTSLIEKDEWTVIDRKKSVRELTEEEKDIRAQKQEDAMRATTDESVWNGTEKESWDYRDRRLYS